MHYLKCIAGTFLLIWLLGLIFTFWGALIHLLLLAAAVILILDYFSNQRKKV